MPQDDRVHTSVRLDRDLYDRLEVEAERRVVGRNLLVNLALRYYLDKLPPINP